MQYVEIQRETFVIRIAHEMKEILAAMEEHSGDSSGEEDEAQKRRKNIREGRLGDKQYLDDIITLYTAEPASAIAIQSEDEDLKVL